MRSKSPSATVEEDSQATDPVLTRGGMQLGQYLTQQEHNPAMAAALATMRQRIAATHPTCGLATLRQRKGLSQAQLAAALDTSQAVIALWEKAPPANDRHAHPAHGPGPAGVRTRYP